MPPGNVRYFEEPTTERREEMNVSSKPSSRIRREGAYVVRAAETAPSRVQPKNGRTAPRPSVADKKLVDAVRKAKQK